MIGQVLHGLERRKSLFLNGLKPPPGPFWQTMTVVRVIRHFSALQPEQPEQPDIKFAGYEAYETHGRVHRFCRSRNLRRRIGCWGRRFCNNMSPNALAAIRRLRVPSCHFRLGDR